MVITDLDKNCIIFNNVSKSFGDKEILHKISLEIPQGSIYGLLGPSGCGKSTSVKIMAGILEPTVGEAFVLGEKMPSLSMMNNIGYMAQSDALYSSLSAVENIKFFASLYGITAKQANQRIEEVMQLVNLTDHLYKPVSAFSGGMKRRLSLAMSLIHLPNVLILDEPTVGIDPLLRKNIWTELKNLAVKGITIIVTTHVMDEAEKCDILAMMREGKIIAQGTPNELIAQSGATTIEEAFILYSSSDTPTLSVTNSKGGDLL